MESVGRLQRELDDGVESLMATGGHWSEGKRLRRKTLTLIHLHIRDGLPLIHGNEPSVLAPSPTAEVDDELGPVAVQRSQDRV